MTIRYCSRCEMVEGLLLPLRAVYVRTRRPVKTTLYSIAKRATWGRKQRFDKIGDWCAGCGFYLDGQGIQRQIADIMN